MNHEELLRKYIAHIVGCEAINYITPLHPDSKISFTDEELVELRRLSRPDGAKGCNRRLADDQFFSFCGETDMGQTLPALCTECGGEFKLAE